MFYTKNGLETCCCCETCFKIRDKWCLKTCFTQKVVLRHVVAVRHVLKSGTNGVSKHVLHNYGVLNKYMFHKVRNVSHYMSQACDMFETCFSLHFETCFECETCFKIQDKMVFQTRFTQLL